MTTRETQSVRLDRIEEKIDRISEVLIQLARVEEKIADLEIRREEQDIRVHKLSEKTDRIDRTTTSISEKVSVMQRVGYVIIGIFVTTIATQLLSSFPV